jgi:NitT/TauT family transport system ATP-binding protein
LNPGNIHIEKVAHQFPGGMVAVEGVSLTIEPGSFVAIVGPSGCGKTTILNLLAGLVETQQGKILISGTAPTVGRSDVAYMMARDALLPWLTAQQNAEFGAAIRGVSPAARHARASQLLDAVGLSDFKQAHPKQLSHGMRQRVALARTFCLDSPILLMDEPFGALDAQTKLQLEEMLLKLWSDERRTVVFITHDLAEAVMMADRVIVMSRRPGRIQADITIDLLRPRIARELQRNARYHELHTQVWEQLEFGLTK